MVMFKMALTCRKRAVETNREEKTSKKRPRVSRKNKENLDVHCIYKGDDK